jgi:hypothetical protein
VFEGWWGLDGRGWGLSEGWDMVWLWVVERLLFNWFLIIISNIGL